MQHLTRPQVASFASLPSDCVGEIFRSLPVDQWHQTALVNRTCAAVARQQPWLGSIKDEFGLTPPEALKPRAQQVHSVLSRLSEWRVRWALAATLSQDRVAVLPPKPQADRSVKLVQDSGRSVQGNFISRLAVDAAGSTTELYGHTPAPKRMWGIGPKRPHDPSSIVCSSRLGCLVGALDRAGFLTVWHVADKNFCGGAVWEIELTSVHSPRLASPDCAVNFLSLELTSTGIRLTAWLADKTRVHLDTPLWPGGDERVAPHRRPAAAKQLWQRLRPYHKPKRLSSGMK